VKLRRRSLAAVVALLAGPLSGCASLHYYVQATAGQLDLLARRVPLQQLRDAEHTPPSLSRRIATAMTIREFAVAELALPDSGSYRSFVALDGDYVVWSLVIAPALSLTPVPSCFPVVGCVSYRGYYRLEDGARAARAARSRGLDVYLAPVPAYSTLGWFDDPLLSSTLNASDAEVARLVFHELTHEKLYVSGDTEFNEAYASAVAEVGLRRWLRRHGSAEERAAAEQARARRAAFLSLVGEARDALHAVYSTPAPGEAKRARKARILRELRAGYGDLKASWGGYTGYDRWFGQDLNNAKLALLGTYSDLVPGFLALLRAAHGDMVLFHRRVRELARATPAQRRRTLRACAGEPVQTCCPG
jgi:predicted aminopeptidase